MQNYTVSQEGGDIVVSFTNVKALTPVRATVLQNFYQANFKWAPYNGYSQTGWMSELGIALAAGADWDTATSYVMNDDYSKVDLTLDGVKVQSKSSTKERDYENYHPNVVSTQMEKTVEANDLIVWSFMRNCKTITAPCPNPFDGKPVRIPARIDMEAPLECVIREGAWTDEVDVDSLFLEQTNRTKSYKFTGNTVPAAELSIFSGVVR